MAASGNRTLAELADGGLIFTNFVDFDTDYGHRRDVAGYAHCLEQFDARLPELFAALKSDDLVVLTADHGNDPTSRGTDHTREHVPILCFGPDIVSRAIGRRTCLGFQRARRPGSPKVAGFRQARTPCPTPTPTTRPAVTTAPLLI